MIKTFLLALPLLAYALPAAAQVDQVFPSPPGCHEDVEDSWDSATWQRWFTFQLQKHGPGAIGGKCMQHDISQHLKEFFGAVDGLVAHEGDGAA